MQIGQPPVSWNKRSTYALVLMMWGHTDGDCWHDGRYRKDVAVVATCGKRDHQDSRHTTAASALCWSIKGRVNAAACEPWPELEKYRVVQPRHRAKAQHWDLKPPGKHTLVALTQGKTAVSSTRQLSGGKWSENLRNVSFVSRSACFTGAFCVSKDTASGNETPVWLEYSRHRSIMDRQGI